MYSNKPGPAQVGAISKAQKQQKDFQVSSILFYSTRKLKILRKKWSKKSHSQKNGPSGAPGPASASPWRAERGTLPKLSTFLSQLKGFCRKTSQNGRAEKFLFSEKKSHSSEKKLKGDPLGSSNIHSVAKQQKN